MSKSRSSCGLCFSAACYALLFCCAAFATPYEGGGNVDQYFGAYTESIPIVVPPYHGLEPKLTVAYSSARGNGLLGVGWSLQGFSVIEQIDSHLELDGQWLVSCDQQTDRENGPDWYGSRSPSCADAQGWYSTLSETYLRIAAGGAGNNTLAVWRKDGTKTLYTPATSGQYPRKWLISTVTDTSGNVVTYNWNGASTGFGFNAPKSITYNGTVIQFYYENRALSETYAENGVFDTMDKELITIDVCVKTPGVTTPCALGVVDANRARAYALTYGASAGTSRPLLGNLTMFGKDAQLSAVGKVTTGHAAPSNTFGWSNPPVTYSTVNLGSLPDWGTDWIRGMVDFNGDGKTDFCRDVGGGPSNWNLKCAISTGWGFVDEWKGQIQNWGDDYSGSWVDWDGDGKSDYCRIVNRAIWCAFSTGAAGNVTAINDMQVGAAFAAGDEGVSGMRWFVDWNGDGRADFCRVAHDSHFVGSQYTELRCAMSQGTGGYREVKIAQLWDNSGLPPGTNYGVPATRAIVDWNGDGVMDFCRIVETGAAHELRCIIGSRPIDRNSYAGGADQVMGTIADTGAADSQWWADVNGDGKVDYCRMLGNGDVRCAVSRQTCYGLACNSNGNNGFIDVLWASLPNSAGATRTRRFGDINNDGKADFCRSGGGTVSCQISAGFSSVSSYPTGAPGEGLYEKNWIVDWNGDGRNEYCSNTGSAGGSGSMLSCVRRDPDQLTDLLTSVSNGIGNTTAIRYTPSSIWLVFTQPPNNNPPTVPTVSSVKTLDGTTSYTYSGGQYDRYTRRFLGFGWVRQTDPCAGAETACPFTETTYRLDYRWPTKPSGVYRYAGALTALASKTLYTYSDTTLTPYRSDLINQTGFLYEGTSFSQTNIAWQYDKYGNVTQVLDGGIVADGVNTAEVLTGDDRALEYGYVPNLPDYILNKPAWIIGRDGLGPTAHKMTEVRYLYDAAANWNTAATQGRVTKTLTWLDTNDNYIGSTSGTAPYYDTVYDSWGNVIASTDANNQTTRYAIDPTYHVYIVNTTKPAAGTPAIAQSTSTALADWDVQCGVRRKETQDSNGGIVTAFAYDDLCRKTRTDFPGSGYEKLSYKDFGIASLQSIETATPGPNGVDLWKRSYFDGLGRTIKIMRTGADTAAGNDSIEAEYSYNARGKVREITRPHYANDPKMPTGYYPQYPHDAVFPRSFYDYDIRDRLIKITQPDNSVRTSTYFLRQATTTDEMGHASADNLDVRGKVWMSGSLVNNTYLNDVVYYQYDGRGYLSQMQQLGQNGTVWSYWHFQHDSLGRKTSVSDPDAGNRRYLYDNVGNLTDEIDANGSQTHYTFDGLRRRTSKTINYVAPCKPIRCPPIGLPGPTPTPAPVTVTWNYDEVRPGYFNVGKLTSMSDPSGTATYNYDAAGNLVSGGRTVDNNSYVFNKQYDTGGRLLATVFPDGSRVGDATQPLVYDAAGNLKTLPGFVDNASYDAAGNLTSYMAANGAYTTFSFDNTTGRSNGYATVGPNTSSVDGTMYMGRYVKSRTRSASINVETFRVESYSVTPGQTITVSTCGATVPGASGTGDTFLRLVNPAGVEVASNNDGGGACGLLSSLNYTVPAGGGGLYSIGAGCNLMLACSGAVVVQIKNPVVNLALNKPATQSSNPFGGDPRRAVDGNTNGNWAASSVAHTGEDDKAWWSVDLQSWYYQIDSITIWNRSDCCGNRLADFDVFVYNPLTNSTTSYYVAGPVGAATTINVGQPGSQVTIRLRGKNYLQLAEVQVFGRDTLILTAQHPLLHKASIQRDLEGRISSVISNRPYENWTSAYSPDAMHQLLSARNDFDASYSRAYTYDSNGNITSGPLGTYTYPTGPSPVGPHAVSSIGATSYSYDNNGQRIGASPGHTFKWDGGGRLINVDGTIDYTYDADGYRLKKTAAGIASIYLGDDYEIINGVHTKYITLGGRLIAKQSGSAQPTWLYTDHQGSVLFSLDELGNEVQSASYYPYGMPFNQSGQESRGYTGQRADGSGLLYLHARFSDPGVGTFISPDLSAPTSRSIGLNRYAYAENDPANRTDIDGMGFFEDAGAWITNSSGDVARAFRSIPDVPESVPFVGGLGIGKTLALLPNTINAAGRGDWQAFGKSIASEAIISSAICVSIIAYGTPAAPGVVAFDAMAVPFALTLVNTGDVDLALQRGLAGIPMYLLLKSGMQAESYPGKFGKYSSSVDPWSGTTVEAENHWYDMEGRSWSGVAGAVIGGIVAANAYVVTNNRDAATGTAPSSQLSSSSGSLYGYGYEQGQPRPSDPSSP